MVIMSFWLRVNDILVNLYVNSRDHYIISKKCLVTLGSNSLLVSKVSITDYCAHIMEIFSELTSS